MAAKVRVSRHGKLAIRLWWKDRHSWEGDVMDRRSIRDTKANRAWIERIATAITAEIGARTFTAARYADYFPYGNRKDELKRANPQDVTEQPLASVLQMKEQYERWMGRIRRKVEIGEARHSLREDYEQHFNSYLLPAFGDRRLSEVTTGDLEDFRLDLGQRLGLGAKGSGLSRKTIKNIISGSLKAFFRDAIKIDKLPIDNPCEGLSWKATDPDEDPDPFEAYERDAMLDWFRRSRPYYFPFVFLLFWTGMRPSEVAGLFWQDVDLTSGLILIRRSYSRGHYGPTKTKKSKRDVRLLPNIVDVLSEAKPLNVGAETPVFKSEKNGLPIKTEEWSKSYSHFNRAIRSLGLRHRKFYATRHTFISRMLNKGAAPSYIASYCGTSTAMIDKHYHRWMDDGETAQLAIMMEEVSDQTERSGQGKTRNPHGRFLVRPENPLRNIVSPTGFESEFRQKRGRHNLDDKLSDFAHLRLMVGRWCRGARAAS